MDQTPTANNTSNALPFSQIPGPNKLSFILSNMPGGKYYKMEFDDMLRMWRKEYGDVLKIPGVFGTPTIVLTHNPDDFQLIFRTEGPWPGRPTFESSDYFRQKIRPDIFGKYLGLLNSQGKEWSDFRKTVNPIMIQPKTAKLYIPKIDEVATDMIDRIHQIRDTNTLQVPDNFEDLLNSWSLESICVIAMNTRLGLIGDNPDPRAAKFIESVKDFFEASFELEFKPSIWRLVATPYFKKLMRSLNVLTELATEYIEEAKKAFEKEQSKPEDKQSVLEKLLKIDNSIATVMAMDMIFAGVDTTDIISSNIEYLNAVPYSKIPGPSRMSLLMNHFPGGKYYKLGLAELVEKCRELYGDIMKIPGMFGRPDVIITHNPNHFETLFRTEGVLPVRIGMHSLEYYRTKVRTDVYGKTLGLAVSQGKEWSDFRTAVNPVMMQPKTMKLYIPKIDKVVQDFIERIRLIRDSETNKVPEHFEEDLNRWTVEVVAVIAMNTRLGLVSDKYDERATKFLEAVKWLFRLIYELDFKPSLWRYIETPKLRKFIAILDTLTDLCNSYVDNAKEELEKMPKTSYKEDDLSVLEKLLKIDPLVAKVMAMDMILAGVDTTSSSLSASFFLLAKNPDKQEILRKEILAVLPDRNTPLTVEKMRHLPYLRACIKEIYRLYPVVSGNTRCAGQDLVLDGYQIPKGTNFLMGSPLLQRDNRYFPRANEFIPERWLKESKELNDCPVASKTAHPFIYLPFGFGPRMCIGRRFAELEVEVMLAKIIRNFYIGWQLPDLKFKSVIVNVPDGKLIFSFDDVEY